MRAIVRVRTVCCACACGAVCCCVCVNVCVKFVCVWICMHVSARHADPEIPYDCTQMVGINIFSQSTLCMDKARCLPLSSPR